MIFMDAWGHSGSSVRNCREGVQWVAPLYRTLLTVILRSSDKTNHTAGTAVMLACRVTPVEIPRVRCCNNLPGVASHRPNWRSLILWMCSHSFLLPTPAFELQLCICSVRKLHHICSKLSVNPVGHGEFPLYRCIKVEPGL